MIPESTLLYFALALHLVSLVAFVFGKTKLSLALLFIGSFSLFLWGASLDHFLNDWDEHFHALVGKNFIHHLLVPTLIDKPVLPYDKTSWYENHIWLHKQPLFLWQIALSISIFGVNELAVRLPSVLLSSIMVLMAYRMGALIFNRRVGYISALLTSTAHYIIMLVSGMGIDHNDISFMFYVTASIWAWIEYEQDLKLRWILIMGIFSGAAVLCKWVAGLLVFAIFGYSHIFIKRDFFSKKIWIAFASSILICALIAIPWQIYIQINFPIEAAFERKYSSRHFTEVIEEHHEVLWYYFNILKNQYQMLQAFIFIGMGITLIRTRKLFITVPLMIGIALVYTFFTIAATKMFNYVLMIMPVMFVFMAAGFDLLIEFIRAHLSKWNFSIFFVVAIVILTYQNLGLKEILNEHSRGTDHAGIRWKAKNNNKNSFLNAAHSLPEDYVIIWCSNPYESIDCMFYSGHTAYGNVTEDLVREMEQNHIKLAVFKQSNLPEFILRDSLICKMPYRLNYVSPW